MSEALNRDRILRLLQLLNGELASQEQRGQLFLVGGAVMCLVHRVRPSTADVDGVFEPTSVLRAAASKIAGREGIPETWLNDAVKGYMSRTPGFEHYLSLSHLEIMVAGEEYLLAMKCLAMRLGEEFRDLDDIRFLLRVLNIERLDAAMDVLGRYYPLEHYPPKTMFALQELLNK